MKRVFTYPNNESDHYIDPELVGDDTVGFQKRIKELKDGTYLAWQGATPSGSVDDIMSDLSKFNNAPWLENEGGNNSINAFWKTPLTAGSVELIENNITSATATDGVDSLIEFSGDHGLYDQQKMTLSNFNNSWSGLNGDSLYVDKQDSDTIKLCTDSDLTLPIQFYDLENCDVDAATATNPAIFQKPIADHDLTGGTLVRATNFDGSFAQFNGNNFYVRQVGPNGFKLSYDNVGTDLIEFPTAQDNVSIASVNVVEGPNPDQSFPNSYDPVEGHLQLKLENTQIENPDGTQVTFDPNNSTVFGIQGANTGMSTQLSVYTASNNVYLQNTNTTNLYELTTDEAGNNKLGINDIGGINICEAIPVTLQLVNDKYSFIYTISNHLSSLSDLDGEYLQYHSYSTSSLASFNSVAASGTYGRYVLDYTGANDQYHINYNTDEFNPDSGRVTLDYDILNAKKVRYSQPTDKEFFFHNLSDTNGSVITDSSFILDDSTIADVSEINTKIHIMTPVRASSLIDNVPTGFQFIDSRTATYDYDTVIDATHNSTTPVISKTLYPGDFTTRETLSDTLTNNVPWEFSNTNTLGFNIITKSNDTQNPSAQDQWVSYIHSQYDNGPQSVVGKVFVANCGDGADYNNFTHTSQRYMVITRVFELDGDDAVGFMLYKANADGSLTTAARLGTSAPYTNETWSGSTNQRFKTFMTNMYNLEDDQTGSSTVTIQRDDIENIVVSGGHSGTRYDLGTSHSLTWTAGQKVTVRVYRTSDDLLMRTTKHATRLADDDPYVTGSFDPSVTHPRYMWLYNLEFAPETYQTTPSLTGFGNNAQGSTQGFADYTQGTYYFTIELHNDFFWQRDDAIYWYSPPADNKLFVSDGINQALTSNKIYGIPYGTANTDVTTADITAPNWTDATQGTLIEVYTPPTANIIPLTDLSNATTGTLTIATDQTNRYRLDSTRMYMPGNLTYMQRTGASTYVNNAQTSDARYQIAGQDPVSTDYGHWPDTTVSTNGSGYVTGISFDTEFPGAFPSENDILMEIEQVPDTYTPPAQSVASQQDNWDLDDAWLTTAYVGGSGKKEWPDNVTPSSASITLNSPTIVNKSQNGIKYSRKSGFTKWTLEVEYPPMTKEDFQVFHGVAQAAQGQAVPFLFKLNNKDGVNILWKDWFKNNDGTILPLFKEDMSAVTTTALFEGFASDTTQAFARGEVIGLDGANDNGDLHTVLTDVDSNAYGEAKIRLTYPVKGANSRGDQARKRPNSCVVTLNSDDFTYSVDHMGYYLVSVAFELDNYK